VGFLGGDGVVGPWGGGKMGFQKNIWGVLVGAFSDFGGLDTDNPVQILSIFGDFALFPFPEGLI